MVLEVVVPVLMLVVAILRWLFPRPLLWWRTRQRTRKGEPSRLE